MNGAHKGLSPALRHCGLVLGFASLAAMTSMASAATGNASLVELQKLDQRVADIGWRIADANRDLCPTGHAALGLTLHNSAQYSPEYRQAANDTFGFADGRPAVLAIADGSPAAKAGMAQSDRLVSIDDEPFAVSIPRKGVSANYRLIDEATTKMETSEPGKMLTLTVLRGESRIDFKLVPVRACASRVELSPGGQLNANSNGTSVQISGRLALWAKTDDELAIVIGHEMAHNILEHNQRIERERIGQGFLSILGADGQKMRDLEREADRYGLYLIARAGYDYRIGPEFWRRLSLAAGLGGIWATTHPSGRNRKISTLSAVREIEGKISAGEPLIP